MRKCPECESDKISDEDCPACNGMLEDDEGNECEECGCTGYHDGYCECDDCGHIDIEFEFEAAD